MALPSLDKVRKLLASGGAVRRRTLAIARKLEAMGEYHAEQALIVAADIVLHSVAKNSPHLFESKLAPIVNRNT